MHRKIQYQIELISQLKLYNSDRSSNLWVNKNGNNPAIAFRWKRTFREMSLSSKPKSNFFSPLFCVHPWQSYERKKKKKIFEIKSKRKRRKTLWKRWGNRASGNKFCIIIFSFWSGRLYGMCVCVCVYNHNYSIGFHVFQFCHGLKFIATRMDTICMYDVQ